MGGEGTVLGGVLVPLACQHLAATSWRVPPFLLAPAADPIWPPFFTQVGPDCRIRAGSVHAVRLLTRRRHRGRAAGVWGHHCSHGGHTVAVAVAALLKGGGGGGRRWLRTSFAFLGQPAVDPRPALALPPQVALESCSMVLCSLIHASILRIGRGYVSRWAPGGGAGQGGCAAGSECRWRRMDGGRLGKQANLCPPHPMQL